MDVIGVYSTPPLYNEISVAVDSNNFHLAYKDSNGVIIKSQGPLSTKCGNAQYKPVVRLVPVLLPVVEDLQPDGTFHVPKSHTLVNKKYVRLLAPKQSALVQCQPSGKDITEQIKVLDVTNEPSSFPAGATKVTFKDRILAVQLDQESSTNRTHLLETNASSSITIQNISASSPASRSSKQNLLSSNVIETVTSTPEVTTFECNHCDYNTTEFKDFWKHIQKHNVSIDCPFCNKSFRFKDTLKEHLKDVHNSENDETSVGRTNKATLKDTFPDNNDNSSNEASSICSSFDENSNSQFLFDDEPTPEELSDEIYSDGVLEFSVPLHEDESILSNRIRGKKDKADMDYQNIKDENPEEENLFYCAYCGHIAENFESFAAHYANHKQNKSFLCPLCDVFLSSNKELFVHIETTHKLMAIFDDKGEMHIYPQGSERAVSPKVFELKDYKVEDDSDVGVTIEYYCQICDFFNTDYEKYSLHVRTKHKKLCFCPSCKLQFDNEIKMFEHFKTMDCGMFGINKNGNFKCNLCENLPNSNSRSVFHVEKDLNSHLKNVHNEPMVKCVFCDERFHDKKLQVKHMQDVHPFGCRQCRLIFCTDTELYKHRFTHERKNFHCEICGKTFHRPNYFRDHQNHHKGIKTHQCKFCNKMFSYYTNLVEHKYKDHVERPDLLCEICGKVYKLKNSLLLHVKTAHGSSDDRAVVKHQKKSLTEKKHKRIEQLNLQPKKRQRRTNFESKYRCQYCGSYFCNAFILKQHQHLHLKTSHFECSKCHLFFKNAKTLQSHQRGLCDESEAALFYRQQQEPQMKVDRRFKCLHCNVMTVNSWILKQHLTVHYKRNDYKCKCGLYFKTEETLKYHKIVLMCNGSPAPEQPNIEDTILPVRTRVSTSVSKPRSYDIEKVKPNQDNDGDDDEDGEVYEMIELPTGDEDSQALEITEDLIITPDQVEDHYSVVGENDKVAEVLQNVIVQQVGDSYVHENEYVIHVTDDGTPVILPEGTLQNFFVGEDGVQYVVRQSVE